MKGFLIWKSLSELVEITACSSGSHCLYFRITFVFSPSVCLFVSFSSLLSQHWLEPNKAVVRQMKCKCHFCSLCVSLCYFASVCLKRVCLCVYLCMCLLMPCGQACVCLLGAASVWGGQTLYETNYSTPQGHIRTNSTSSWQHTHTHTKWCWIPRILRKIYMFLFESFRAFFTRCILSSHCSHNHLPCSGTARQMSYDDFFSTGRQIETQNRQSGKSRVCQTHSRKPEGHVAQTGNILTHKVKYTDVAGEHEL